MGVSGCGKTTVGIALAERTGWSFIDADNLHPPENVAKMKAGIPLSDDDRWPWLEKVNDWIRARTVAREAGVVACSALKRTYRDLLREARPDLSLVYLNSGDTQILLDRVTDRAHHFFPQKLLQSQLDALEAPRPDEHPITLPIGQSPDEQVDEILALLKR